MREYRGKLLVDVREYYAENDELKPTKKGMHLI